MGTALVALATVVALAGCGTPHELSMQAEEVHSRAAEGALLAEQVSSGDAFKAEPNTQPCCGTSWTTCGGRSRTTGVPVATDSGRVGRVHDVRAELGPRSLHEAGHAGR